MNDSATRSFDWDTTAIDGTVRDAFCTALSAAGFRGDVHFDEAGRLLAATDNSVYQVTPAIVLMPRDGDDLHVIMQVAATPPFQRLALTPRGGGTGTNGQALTNAVVIDTSRYMTRIHRLDAEAGTVRVEPGVVLGQLNAYLADHDLTFPAQISTASRATIGGMIATDACGKGSRIYGKTSDYIESLDVILANGNSMTARTFSADELDTPGDAGAQLALALRALVAPVRHVVEQVFPRISRSLTGYDIQRAFPADGSVQLHRLIAGSEGTLVVIRAITLRVIPTPAARKLAVVRYDNLDCALSDCQRVLSHDPSAIETLDERLYALAQTDPSWGQISHAMEGEHTPAGPIATNFVEFIGDSDDAVDQRIQRFIDATHGIRGYRGHYVADNTEEQGQLWAVRSKGVGLLARAEGPRKPIAFVEDTVVPPEHLPDYIREFRAILDNHGVEYGMFGHVDVGCLHVRPALDMTQESDAQLLRVITDEVVALVKRYGGLLWGEHGKGYRGEFAKDFFGQDLYPVLGQIKHAFDPHNRMNPGKIVTPRPELQEVASIDAVPFRGSLDGSVPSSVRRKWTKAFECNGNGVCFDWDASVPICPSYKVTRDRVQSPKGRAALLREWLRLRQGVEPARAHTIEQQLFQSMEGCLGCNACASQCPVHVSIPELRSRFYEAYHETHRRPLHKYLLGNVERLIAVGRRVPALINPLLRLRPVRRLAERHLSLVDTPDFSWPRLERRADCRVSQPGGTSVVLLLDPYTTAFDADVPAAALRLLQTLGCDVSTVEVISSGKAAHVQGMRQKAARHSRRVLKRLAAAAGQGQAVIALEPSVALHLRQDVEASVDSPVAGRIVLLNEWLNDLAADVLPAWLPGPTEQPPYGLLTHCTESTALPDSGQRWERVFRRFGLSLRAERAGCCGMAGTYGHLRDNQERSKALYAMSWQQHAGHYGERLLATGFSCRCQVARLSNFRPRHPVEVLAQRVLGLSQDTTSKVRKEHSA